MSILSLVLRDPNVSLDFKQALCNAEHVERVECHECEGSGRIEFGESGAYYRDGEQYDAPGSSRCDHCGGAGYFYEADDEPGEDPRIQADRDREIDDRSAA